MINDCQERHGLPLLLSSAVSKPPFGTCQGKNCYFREFLCRRRHEIVGEIAGDSNSRKKRLHSSDTNPTKVPKRISGIGIDKRMDFSAILPV